jgi:SNF2 family DNA or RNA helicase
MMAQNIIVAHEPNVEAKLEAFPFQREAFEEIKDLEFAAVFHEQGLGKTKIAIDVALYWLETKVVDSIIIVTKKGLVQNWLREIKQHSHLHPRIITQDGRANFYAFNSPSRLYITHYEAIVSEKNRIILFQKSRSAAIILDEAQKIKNPESNLAKTFHALSGGFVRRLILTGTPVANRTFDIWSQVFFLDKGKSLGNRFAEFKRLYDLPNREEMTDEELAEYEQRMSELFHRISAFSVRETKSGSGLALPKKEYVAHIADWEDIQHEMYLAYRDELAAIVIRDGVPTEDRAEDLLKRILRLVQIASNPLLVDQGYDRTPGKFVVLESIVSEIVDQNEKVIVWTSFTENASWLRKQFSMFGAVQVHGKISMLDRERALTKFMTSSECKVLIATPGAAKEGLTLTMANHVVFYDRTFSLDDYLQAQDRIHRISQVKTCYVHNILMQESVDEWIDILINAKHWSAKLAQGDVALDEYADNMNYTFREVMRNVLGIGEKQ